MQTLKKCMIVMAVVVGLTVSTKAQEEVREYSYIPGETIRLSVVFGDVAEGEKLTCANFNAGLISGQNPKQAGFQTAFSANCKQVNPTSFELSFTIPDNQCDGEYKITAVFSTVNVGNGRVDFSYGPSDGVPEIKFKIVNDRTAPKPALKSVTVLPKS